MSMRWEEMPEAEWDGETGMVYSDVTGEFYKSWEEVHDGLECSDYAGESVDFLQLVLCVPQYARLTEDAFENVLPDDESVPDELKAAIEAFNERMQGIPISWTPGKFRVKEEK